MTNQTEDLIAKCDHIHAEEIVRVVLLLGLSAYIEKLGSDLDVHDLLQKGLLKSAVHSLVKRTGFNLSELSIATSISKHALQQMCIRVDRKGRLTAQQSDCVLQRNQPLFRIQTHHVFQFKVDQVFQPNPPSLNKADVGVNYLSCCRSARADTQHHLNKTR